MLTAIFINLVNDKILKKIHIISESTLIGLIFYCMENEIENTQKHKLGTRTTVSRKSLAEILPSYYSIMPMIPICLFSLLRDTKSQSEIFLHKGKAFSQLDLWLPPQDFFCLGDVWFPLSRIIWSVLHRLYLHVGIDKLQNNTSKYFISMIPLNYYCYRMFTVLLGPNFICITGPRACMNRDVLARREMTIIVF